MKIQLLTSLVTFREQYHEGDIVERPDKEARRLIATGQAVPVRGEEVETQVRAAPETAARRRGRPRKSEVRDVAPENA